MRLFLSSQDLGNYPEVAAKLAGSNKKIAFIKNAQDDKSPKERNLSTPFKKQMFEAAGFDFHELDLRDYFGKPAELEEELSSFGAVWCSGGDTYILRRAMRLSGLDDLLVHLLTKDKIMYGGTSAGSAIIAPSLHGSEFGDRPEPEAVPEDYPDKETIWEGLNLVSFSVVPHYKSDWFGEDADRSIEYFKKHNIPYKVLRDGQVFVIDGEKEELLS